MFTSNLSKTCHKCVETFVIITWHAYLKGSRFAHFSSIDERIFQSQTEQFYENFDFLSHGNFINKKICLQDKIFSLDNFAFIKLKIFSAICFDFNLNFNIEFPQSKGKLFINLQVMKFSHFKKYLIKSESESRTSS